VHVSDARGGESFFLHGSHAAAISGVIENV